MTPALVWILETHFLSDLVLSSHHQEVFFVTANSETFVETSSVINNQIERATEESGWTIAAANGTNTTLGMSNMLVENNTNVKVSRAGPLYGIVGKLHLNNDNSLST